MNISTFLLESLVCVWQALYHALTSDTSSIVQDSAHHVVGAAGISACQIYISTCSSWEC